MPPLSEQSKKLLASMRTGNRKIIPYLLKAKRSSENAILSAAARGNLATSARIRDGLYSELFQVYKGLNGDLTKWTHDMTAATAKDWHDLAVSQLPASAADTVTRFSVAHVKDYFDRVSPGMAAQNAAMNPNVTKMLNGQIQLVRKVFVDVQREAALSGMTLRQMGREMLSRVLDQDTTWAFIDAGGSTWKAGNYFQMLVRTTTATVARESYLDTLTEAGFQYVEIMSDGSPCETCAGWAGEVVCIGESDGVHATLEEAIADGLHHPNCCCMELAVDPVADADKIAAEPNTPDPEPDPEPNMVPAANPEPQAMQEAS